VLDKNTKFFIAGHKGMVGSTIMRRLEVHGYDNLITRSHGELDLTDQRAVHDFFQTTAIDYVVVAAAKVGGIFANNEYPANFIYENLMIECNIIHQAHDSGVRQLLFLGTACIYPKLTTQPIKEEALLSGPLEPTNEPYAIAKIAGIKLCESYNRQFNTDYRSIMPNNIYGPNDTYHDQNSHVIPALIKRFHEAKTANQATVDVWGTGQVKREFLHVDDLASACVFVMNLDRHVMSDMTQEMISHINVGSGREITIRELAEAVGKTVGYKGELVFDTSKPDGTPRKFLDSSKLRALGWQPEISLNDGLKDAYADYLRSLEAAT